MAPLTLAIFDAIKWGSTVSNHRLSTHFYSETDKCMACSKKEFVDQKKGEVDELEADAISSTLLKLILKWVFKKDSIFVIISNVVIQLSLVPQGNPANFLNWS